MLPFVKNWGSFVLARDIPLGCDARRASWEAYHPHFMARQLGLLQGCPVPLLTFLSLLSRGRLSGSSDKECRDTENEFQERCKKFRLRPTVPETLSTDTFGDWWETYTRDFFGESVDDTVTIIFSDCPQKAAVLPSKEKVQGIRLSLLLLSRRFLDPNSHFSGGRVLKQAAVITAVVAKRSSIISKRADTTRQTPTRPCQEAEPTREAPRPHKDVKELAKKGEREIHVISSQTTEATASDPPSAVPTA